MDADRVRYHPSLDCSFVVVTPIARRGAVTDRGWKRPFDDPISLPRGRQLVTLEDAAAYITELPKAEQLLDERQANSKAWPLK